MSENRLSNSDPGFGGAIREAHEKMLPHEEIIKEEQAKLRKIRLEFKGKTGIAVGILQFHRKELKIESVDVKAENKLQHKQVYEALNPGQQLDWLDVAEKS